MKRIMKNLTPVVIVAVAATLASFEMRPGAHSFQVFVDEKLVIERFADRNMKPQTIELTKESKTIDVRYNECNRTVSGRSLTAKGKDGSVLKVWQFEETTSGFKDPMACQVKEIQALALKNNNEVRIYYASNDFPEGIHIFSASFGSAAVASGN